MHFSSLLFCYPAEKAMKLAQCRNLGLRSISTLEKVGINTIEELRCRGAAGVYWCVKQSGEPASLNLL